jgi:hypothetical protein
MVCPKSAGRAIRSKPADRSSTGKFISSTIIITCSCVFVASMAVRHRFAAQA